MSEDFDVCPECKKEDDVTPKELFACKYCGRLLCQIHKDARIVYIPTLKGESLGKTRWGRAILLELQRKNTHPCFAYTRIFWQNFEAQNKQGFVLRNKALDYLAHESPSTEPSKPTSAVEDDPFNHELLLVSRGGTLKLGLCPKCHHRSDKILEYDAETITFQCERCSFVFSQFKASPHAYVEQPEPTKKPISTGPTIKKKQFPLKKTIITISIIVLITGALVWFSPQFLLTKPYSSVSPNPSTTPFLPSTTPSSTPTLPDVTPTNTLLETFTHEELINYALSLINSDRQSQGLQNVTLSSVDSGQSHADAMLTNDFFSHWDTNGYKPYMRYTIAGGKGAVAENCAWQGLTGNIVDIDVKSALEDMEWSMMYDDASSNWGHRDNILSPLHNKVSIGIAYDHNNVYFVEDFEDDYISWSTLSLSNQVQMQGTILKAEQSISQIAIYFDNPTSLTTQQLSNSPYQSGYDAGTYVGMLVAPPPSGSQYLPPEEGILIVANTWSDIDQAFNINFDMSTAFAQCGRGVYTLYLWTDSNNYFTTLSIWNQQS